MNEQIDHDKSRILGVASKLAGQKLNAETVYARIVVLTGEEETLATENGRWCFVDALRLLCRVVGRLTVALPNVDAEFELEIRGLCDRLWARSQIEIVNYGLYADFSTAVAVLNVGSRARPGLPWTTINSNGWVARVSSGAQPLPASCKQPNPIAALMAASLGVSEVFKRVFQISEEKAPLLDRVEFSLFDLSNSPSGFGPPLANEVLLPDTVLFGAGAIGNAVALVLSQLPLVGNLHVVDKQDYASENWETCTQTERTGWVGEAKATRLALWLKQHSRLKVTSQKNLIATALSTPELKTMNVDLVLNGLDDPRARHDTQRLWAATTVDGGISEVGAGVVQHRLSHADMACLICSYEIPTVNVLEQQSKATGLSIAALMEGDRLITEADVQLAPSEHQDQLREMVKAKRKICSIVLDLKGIGIDAEDGFQPSAPFVASASAALVVGEALKAICFPETKTAQQFLFGNLFLGPESGIAMRRGPSAKCRCVVHRKLLEAEHSKRQAIRDGM